MNIETQVKNNVPAKKNKKRDTLEGKNQTIRRNNAPIQQLQFGIAALRYRYMSKFSTDESAVTGNKIHQWCEETMKT